jgi:hypothetical protein
LIVPCIELMKTFMLCDEVFYIPIDNLYLLFVFEGGLLCVKN